MPSVVDIATAVAAVCGALIAVAGAAAVAMRLGRWAYAETRRRHRLDRIADLERPLTQVAAIAPQLAQVAELAPALAHVVHELSPNSGTSLFDRVTQIADEMPVVRDQVENVTAYVEELKAREQRGRGSSRPFREPPSVLE